MAEPESTVRQRKTNTSTEKDEIQSSKPNGPEKASKIDDEDAYSPWLDIFRVLTFICLASCGLSYLISGGESWTWGMKHLPDPLRIDWWKSQFRGPLYLTPEQLAAYDGTDETKPIYLSINGTIYDVSANRRVYGPGGSYHVFSGVDASRGFVTGCFLADRNGDMRGVEEMYLPLDSPEVDKHWTPEEMAVLREQELARARERVHEALKHWVDFFGKSKKYTFVGYLKRPKGWEGEPKPLCDVAQNGRTARMIPGQEDD